MIHIVFNINDHPRTLLNADLYFFNGVDSAGNEARLRRNFRKAIRVDKFKIMYFSSASPREDIGLYVWNVAALLGIGLMHDKVIFL